MTTTDLALAFIMELFFIMTLGLQEEDIFLAAQEEDTLPVGRSTSGR